MKMLERSDGERMAIEGVRRKDGENQGTNTMKALQALLDRLYGVRLSLS